MSTVAEIEAAITKLSQTEAEEVREWLEQWIEDQREMTPEFLASIERGKADFSTRRQTAGGGLSPPRDIPKERIEKWIADDEAGHRRFLA